MFGAETEDNLIWLAEKTLLTLSRHNGQWSVTLGDYEMPDANFDGPALEVLLAAARAWSEAPEAERLPGRDWLRLCQAAARVGKSPRQLLQQGASELLDRLDAEG